MDEDEQKKIREAYGEKEEEAVVMTHAIDKNGKQIGTPVRHTLRRVGGEDGTLTHMRSDSDIQNHQDEVMDPYYFNRRMQYER